MRVVPSAQDAATARMGYSSIMVGARSAGTSTPFSAAALDAEIGHRLAADLAFVLEGDVGAHVAQRLVEAGAQRIDADILDRDVAARPDRRGDDGEGRRRGIARHDDVAARSSGQPTTVMRLPPPSAGTTRTSAPKWRSMRSV